MASHDSSDKSHLFKSTWNHKETKVIRVPVEFADVVLSIARKLDAGESLDEISALVEQNQFALDWERCDEEIQAALKNVPLESRAAVRAAMMKLLSLAYFQASTENLTDQAKEEILKARERLTFQSNLSKEWVDPPEDWNLPEQSLKKFVQQQQAYLDSQETQPKTLTLDSKTEHRIAGVVLLILDLLRPQLNEWGGRGLDGEHFYAFVQRDNEVFVLSVESSLPSEHYTVLRLHRVEGRDGVVYQFDSRRIQIKDIQRFAVAEHYLEMGLARAATQEEREAIARDVLKFL